MSEAYRQADRRFQLVDRIRARIQQQGLSCETWVELEALASDIESQTMADYGCTRMRGLQ
jgi:hypothetical protein